MKTKLKCTIILLLTILQLNLLAQVWTLKASLPINSSPADLNGAVGFNIGTKGYLVTGQNNSGIGSAKLWEYDQLSDTWTTKSDFPGTMRTFAVSFVIGSKAYIGTGYSVGTGIDLNDFWEWDQLTNTWTQKANFAGTARRFAAAFSLNNNKGYIGTGWAGSNLASDVWEYDPSTNVWVKKADFPTVRYAASSFGIGNKGYICSGDDGMGGTFPNDLWEYDPSTNNWTAKANLPASGGLFGAGRDNAFSFVIGSNGYIGAGNFVNPSISFMPLGCQDFWQYNSSTNVWTQLSSYMGGKRQWTAGFSVGTKGYCATGEASGDSYNDLWEYGINTVDIFEQDFTSFFSIFPNPSIKHFTISFNDTKIRYIKLINLLGEVVYTNIIDEPSMLLNTDTYSKGIYYVNVIEGDKQFTKKLIIQ